MLTLDMAFFARPRLLMIDELSLGLAPVIVEQLVDIVRAIRDQGHDVLGHPTGQPSGALHPHFSPDGSFLVWAQYDDHPPQVTPGDAARLQRDELVDLTERSITQLFGRWSLGSAAVCADLASGLADVHTVQPAGRPGFCETHDVTADNAAVLISANPDPWQPLPGIDILVVDPARGDIRRRVTSSHDEWDEHAHFAKSESGRIVWTSSRDLRPDGRYPFDAVATPGLAARPPRADLWVAEADGTQWPCVSRTIIVAIELSEPL